MTTRVPDAGTESPGHRFESRFRCGVASCRGISVLPSPLCWTTAANYFYARLSLTSARSSPSPKEVQAAAHWLTQAAEHGGPFSFAHIGVMRALNRHVER